MSLLLDALQRSEQRPLTLTPTDDIPPIQAPSDAAAPPPLAGPVVAPVAPHAPKPAAASTAQAAPGAARQAAQTMVGAAASSAAQVPRARARRLVFSLLLGLLLAVVSWFGWQYWQSSQHSMLAVTPSAAQSVGGEGAAQESVGAVAPNDAQAPDRASAAMAGGGDPSGTVVPALVGDAQRLGAQPPAAALVGTAEPVAPTPPATLPARQPVGAVPLASETGVPPEPRVPRTPVAPAPVRSAAAVETNQAPAQAAQALPGESSPSSAAVPTPPSGAAAASGRAGKLPAALPQNARLVRSEAQRNLQNAWTALGQGDAVRAQALYQQVLAERPDDPDATLGLAVALHRQRQLEPAWAAYQRSLHLWPENETARTGLLAILSESDPVTAESRLQEWVQTRPRDAAAQSALGNLLGRQGRWADALGPLTQAHSLAPERAAHAYNLAVALDQARRYEDALRMYRQALQIGGTGIPVKAIENRLQDLQEQLSR